ncbi:MAG: hypothetical protein K2R98_11340 [Gemmataceae bacterium]|nr:hypothetical protein [Gemmataceae bacterium]
MMRKFMLGILGVALTQTIASAQEKVPVPAGTPVVITVTPGTAPAPPASITLYERHGHVTPCKGKCTHTGGGNIDVASPSADTVVVTMTGVAVSESAMDFTLDQCFEVTIDNPKVKKIKLSIEGRVIGLLRGEKKGCAEYSDACANISAGPAQIIALCVPPHKVCSCESLSVNDHDGPKTVPLTPGKYTLHQTFHIAAYGGCFFSHKASAEFAPDPALDPLWISYHEPFRGASKKDFGFQVTIKVVEDTDEAPAPEKKVEDVPPPKEIKDK